MALDGVNAQVALIDLWDAVRSKPQDHVTMRLPLYPSTETAAASTELTDTTPSTRIPPVFATNAAHHLYAVSEANHIESQLLVLSISKEFARQVLTPFAWTDDNAARQLVALSVHTDVAKQLLLWVFTEPSEQTSDSSSPVDADSAHPVFPVVPVASFTKTDAAHQLLALFNSNRSAPSFAETDAAHQLLALFNSNRSAPSFTETDAAHQLLALSNSNRVAPSSPVLTEKDCLGQLTKLFESSGPPKIGPPKVDPPKIVPTTSVFSDAELATAVKLLEILDSSDKELPEVISRGNNHEKDILMAHSLLDRFAFQNRQEFATTEFSSDDINAAHQLRTLFVSEDAKGRVGPIFLVFPDVEPTLRLVLLSDSEDAARLLLKRSTI
ncbi:hypothetical protein MMC22_001159 [Lobaria immixta]|nr:hypothetical protein [Lobaria immixta]